MEKFIVELIQDIAGKEVVSLVELMSDKPVSEFKLAKKLKETVNQVRNRLYKLYSYNLVDFIRKKDKKKGWYIYYWAFDRKRAVDLALDFKRKRIEHITQQLEKEKKSEYFICKHDNTRLSLELAMESNFRCPECDEILIRDENIKRINQIKREISKLKTEIAEINKILQKEREKELRRLERAKKRKVKKKPRKKAKRKVKKRKKKPRKKKKTKKKPKRKIKKKLKKKSKKKIKKKTKRKAKKKTKKKPKRKSKKRTKKKRK